jgi:acyl-CoA thioester hydrolase
VSCTFKSPAYLDETLRVKIRTSELKRSSFVMEYEMIEEKTSRLVATGKSVAVAYNYKEQKTIPIPDFMRQKFEEVEKRKF